MWRFSPQLISWAHLAEQSKHIKSIHIAMQAFATSTRRPSRRNEPSAQYKEEDYGSEFTDSLDDVAGDMIPYLERDPAGRRGIKMATQVLDSNKLLQSLSFADGSSEQAISKGDGIMKMRLEKKKKKISKDQILTRQLRIGTAIQTYMQQLLVHETEFCTHDYYVDVYRVDMAPDLRRAILYWAITDYQNPTLDRYHTDARVVDVFTDQLEKRLKWFRVQLTRQMNLKYSPILELRYDVRSIRSFDDQKQEEEEAVEDQMRRPSQE